MVIKTAVLIAQKDMDFINAVKKLKAKNCIRVYGMIGGVTVTSITGIQRWI